MAANEFVNKWTYVPNASSEKGSHLYVRETIIHLDVLLQKLSPNTRYLHLYCDILSVAAAPKDGNLIVASLCPGTKLRYIHIYSRQFLPSNVRSLDLGQLPSLKVKIFFESANTDFELLTRQKCSRFVNFKPSGPLENEKQLETLVQQVKSIGREIRLNSDGDNFDLVDLYSVPYTETDPPVSPPRGTIASHSGPAELLTLLEALFNHASTLLLKDSNTSAECISIYRFIIACSSASVAGSNLFTCTQKLLQRLELPMLYPDTEKSTTVLRVTVPSLSFGQYEKQFEANMEGAKMLAAEIKELATDEKEANSAKVILDAIAKSIESFSNNTQADERDVTTAMDDLHRANTAAEQAAEDVTAAKGVFQSGIDEYAARKKREFQDQILSSVCQCTFGIVVGVSTMGAGSALATGNIVKVIALVDEGKELVSNGEKLIHVLKKLAEVVAKVAPKLYTSYKADKAMGNTTQDYQKVASDAQDLATRSTALPSLATEPFDYVSLMADWEELRETIDLTFIEFKTMLGSDVVSGLEPYRTSLRKMCIRGQSVLDARRLAQDEVSRYLRNTAELNARAARGRQISAMKSDLPSAGAAGRISALVAGFCRAIKEADLAAAKRDLFVLFHTCCNSVMYLVAASTYPNFSGARVRVAADMSLAQFQAAVVKLKDWQVEGLTRLGTAGDYDVALDTGSDERGVFGPDWRAVLRAEKRVRLAVPYDLSDLGSSFGMRVEKFSLTLKDLALRKDLLSPKTGGKTSVLKLQYTVVFGPQCKDRNQRGEVIQYYMKPVITAPRNAIAREQKSSPLWNDKTGVYANPTPLAQISINLNEEEAKMWDLESVSGIEIEMGCKVHTSI